MSTNPITAEVIEVPKPDRPELWANVYVNSRGAWDCCVFEERLQAESAMRCPRVGDCIVRVPASTAAAEPDAVEELRRLGYRVTIEAAVIRPGYTCVVVDDTSAQPKMIAVRCEMPDYKAAARACLAKIRGGK